MNRNIIPLFFLLCPFYLFFFPIDLRLTCVCVVIGTTRYCAKDPYFLRYCYSVDCCGAQEICQEDPYYSVSSVNSWRTRCHFQEDPCILLYCHQLIAGAHDVLTSNNNNSQQSAQFLQPHNKAFETLLPDIIITPSFRSASTFRL